MRKRIKPLKIRIISKEYCKYTDFFLCFPMITEVFLYNYKFGD